MTGAHFAAVAVFTTFAVAVSAVGIVAIIEHIITKRQIEELNRAHGGMKVATSWLSCHAILGASNTCPVMESERVSVVLPEIVRCRDCKLCDEENYGAWGRVWFCEKFGDVEPNGYCSLGERKG